MDKDTFTFIADHMSDESNPAIIFFPRRLSWDSNYCFQSSNEYDAGFNAGFDAAIRASTQIESADEVTHIRMVRGTITSVTAN